MGAKERGRSCRRSSAGLVGRTFVLIIGIRIPSQYCPQSILTPVSWHSKFLLADVSIGFEIGFDGDGESNQVESSVH